MCQRQQTNSQASIHTYSTRIDACSVIFIDIDAKCKAKTTTNEKTNKGLHGGDRFSTTYGQTKLKTRSEGKTANGLPGMLLNNNEPPLLQ